MNEFLRQQDILLPSDLRELDVDIVGAGSLGGAILVCLCKMGFGILSKITVTDYDRCLPHNLPTQWFRASDAALERPKVEALADMAAFVCDREISIVEERFTGAEERRLGPVVILTVDSLEERRRISRRLRQRDDVEFIVDARAGAEVVEICCLDVRKDDPGAYERSLAEGEEPHRPAGTCHAIFYTVSGAASFVGSILRAYARGEEYPRHLAFDFRHFFVEADRSALSSARP